jgi:hypothetical protein
VPSAGGDRKKTSPDRRGPPNVHAARDRLVRVRLDERQEARMNGTPGGAATSFADGSLSDGDDSDWHLL